MARQLTTNQQIDAYVQTVIGLAGQHASSVAAVIMPLSVAVRARLNLSKDTVEVFERNGKLGRVCWVTIQGRRYFFNYNYMSGKIDLKRFGTQGPFVFDFDNNTPHADILTQAARL